MSGEEVTYAYDTLNRLISAVTTGPEWGQSFSYDGFGNRTAASVTKGSAPASSFNIDAATNRIFGAGFSYDANGNMTVAPALTSITYSVANRVTSATGAGGLERYEYAPDGKRIWKRMPNGTEEFYFYGIAGRKLGTYRAATGPNGYGIFVLDTNLYFGSKLLRSKGATVVTDALGSVRASGATTYRYFPYGEEQQVTAQDKEKFATYYRDQTTGLDYAQNRYYANTIGRFTSPDPYMASAGLEDPGSWNRYTYVVGDPIRFNDPSGLFYCDMLKDPGQDIDCSPNGGGGGLFARPGDIFRSGDVLSQTQHDLRVAEAFWSLNPGNQTTGVGSTPAVQTSIYYATGDSEIGPLTPVASSPAKPSASSTAQSSPFSALADALTFLPQMFYSGFVDALLNDNVGKGASQVVGSLALAVGPQAIAQALAPSTLYHFTSLEAAAAITASGSLLPGPGFFGFGVYGSAFTSPVGATLMGAASTEAVIPFSSGLGTAASAFGPFVIPGAYRVITPLTLFGGVPIP